MCAGYNIIILCALQSSSFFVNHKDNNIIIRILPNLGSENKLNIDKTKTVLFNKKKEDPHFTYYWYV